MSDNGIDASKKTLIALARRRRARRVGRKGGARDSDAPEQVQNLKMFWLDRYVPYIKTYKKSWSTDHSILGNHLIPAFGMLKFEDISIQATNDFFLSLKNKGYSAATQNRILVIFKYSIELSIRWGLNSCKTNPLKYLKGKKVENQVETFLDKDHALRLAEVAKDSRNRNLIDLITFLLYTGARRAEVLQARWIDIDIRHKVWKISKSKSGKPRYIPLSEAAMEVLTRCHSDSEDSAYVFPNPRTGLPYTSVFASWNSVRMKAGLPNLRMHDLRHSFASYLVNSGRSLYEVQELLGHADLRTTTRYAHLAPERLLAAVECVPKVHS